MCVARYASHYFSKGAICVPLDDQEKNICTLSSHRATSELYAKVPSHRAPVGALCEGSMRIELRSELYVKGALCGSTMLLLPFIEYICVPSNFFLKFKNFMSFNITYALKIIHVTILFYGLKDRNSIIDMLFLYTLQFNTKLYLKN